MKFKTRATFSIDKMVLKAFEEATGKQRKKKSPIIEEMMKAYTEKYKEEKK